MLNGARDHDNNRFATVYIVDKECEGNDLHECMIDTDWTEVCFDSRGLLFAATNQDISA